MRWGTGRCSLLPWALSLRGCVVLVLPPGGGVPSQTPGQAPLRRPWPPQWAQHKGGGPVWPELAGPGLVVWGPGWAAAPLLRPLAVQAVNVLWAVRTLTQQVAPVARGPEGWARFLGTCQTLLWVPTLGQQSHATRPRGLEETGRAHSWVLACVTGRWRSPGVTSAPRLQEGLPNQCPQREAGGCCLISARGPCSVDALGSVWVSLSRYKGRAARGPGGRSPGQEQPLGASGTHPRFWGQSSWPGLPLGEGGGSPAPLRSDGLRLLLRQRGPAAAAPPGSSRCSVPKRPIHQPSAPQPVFTRFLLKAWLRFPSADPGQVPQGRGVP